MCESKITRINNPECAAGTHPHPTRPIFTKMAGRLGSIKEQPLAYGRGLRGSSQHFHRCIRSQSTGVRRPNMVRQPVCRSDTFLFRDPMEPAENRLRSFEGADGKKPRTPSLHLTPGIERATILGSVRNCILIKVWLRARALSARSCGSRNGRSVR